MSENGWKRAEMSGSERNDSGFIAKKREKAAKRQRKSSEFTAKKAARIRTAAGDACAEADHLREKDERNVRENERENERNEGVNVREMREIAEP